MDKRSVNEKCEAFRVPNPIAANPIVPNPIST